MKVISLLVRALVILTTIFLVLGAIVGPRTAFTSFHRARSCASNLGSIDKMVGVWESQHVSIPTTQPAWLEVDSRGFVTRTSATLAALMDANPGIRAANRLAPGSTAVFDYTKDVNLFICPSRAVTAGSTLLERRETLYRWIVSPVPLPELGGRTRGTICLLHGAVGERDDPEAVHALPPRAF